MVEGSLSRPAKSFNGFRKPHTPASNRLYRQKHSAAAITNQGESELKIVIEHFNAGKKACGVMGRV